jgi:hypothetical protein
LRVIVVLVVPAIPPPLTAVESVDCPHRASSSDWLLAKARISLNKHTFCQHAH